MYPSVIDIILYLYSHKAFRARLLWFVFGLLFGAVTISLFSPPGDEVDEELIAAAAEPIIVTEEKALASQNQPTQETYRVAEPAPAIPAPKPAIVAEPTEPTQQFKAKRGDTFSDLLARAGAGNEDMSAIVSKLRKIYDPRDLKAGQTVTVVRKPTGSGEDAAISHVHFQPSLDKIITLTRNDNGGYGIKQASVPLSRKVLHASATIDHSLLGATHRAGVPESLAMEMIKAFSYDVDFQRDIQEGDRFEVLFERYYNPDGKEVRDGRVIYAALRLGDHAIKLYRYTHPDGSSEFYDEAGNSVKKALLRTPMNGVRISSGFGMRRHPIMGYSKMHRGVDFAAAAGTPIFAAGDGVIAYMGRKGGYGNYVQIRHSGTQATAYAHLSRFAGGLSAGRRVNQGDVIGYVGSTGLATGPHLHYEVLAAGKQVNPLNAIQPANHKLDGRDYAAFVKQRDSVTNLIASLPRSITVAENNAAAPLALPNL